MNAGRNMWKDDSIEEVHHERSGNSKKNSKINSNLRMKVLNNNEKARKQADSDKKNWFLRGIGVKTRRYEIRKEFFKKKKRVIPVERATD